MNQHGSKWLLALFTLISYSPSSLGDDARSQGQPDPPAWREGFEVQPIDWKFIGGEEFPGARGSLTLDSTRVHGGKTSARLDADFQGGGVYVGVWKELTPLKLPDIKEFRFWVQAENLKQVGIRVVDATGQCHQRNFPLPAAAAAGWTEVVIPIRALVGGEHWGGRNDGSWHGPPAGLGINVGRDGMESMSRPQARLWLDNLSAVGVAAGIPLLADATLEPSSCRPGYGTRIRYTWEAQPLGSNCSVFVHFVNSQGQMIFQADNDPPVPTLNWSGRVEYARTAVVPLGIAPGRYDVVVGLWDGRPAEVGGGRKPFRVGSQLQAIPGDACRIGTLTVANEAPLPTLPPVTLNLDHYRLTFAEDFDGPLSISAWGPATRWIAHTPYAGDFGDAVFADPGPNSPFSVQDGMLRIEAKKVGDRWQSGLISSVDPQGDGFAQRFGYFEMRAQLPQGLGTWPAFWLMGTPQLKQPKDKKTIPQIEIDVLEQYGVGPNALHTTLHLWGPDKYHWAEGDTTVVTGMTTGFHTYGVAVEDDVTIFYFDGAEIRRDVTPQDAKVPLYLMVDLALGGGWPIDRTPNPSVMLVDHIRVYARK